LETKNLFMRYPIKSNHMRERAGYGMSPTRGMTCCGNIYSRILIEVLGLCDVAQYCWNQTEEKRQLWFTQVP
jgi:hypothetical protein